MLDVVRENLILSGKAIDGNGRAVVYEGIQDIVVRVSRRRRSNAQNRSSLMFNCHFDTAQLSPGASDGVVGCGIMLELLNAFIDDDPEIST